MWCFGFASLLTERNPKRVAEGIEPRPQHHRTCWARQLIRNVKPQRTRHDFYLMPSEHFDAVDAVFCSLAELEKQRGGESITDIERVVLLVERTRKEITDGQAFRPYRVTRLRVAHAQRALSYSGTLSISV